MGGTRNPAINLPGNLLTLCGSGTTGCHGRVEANPSEAQHNGWSVSRYREPTATPVNTWRGWMLLDHNGHYHRVPEPVFL